MAHDFNNALAAINGYATLIDDDLAASSPIKTEISRIIEAVKRAAELNSKCQDFARDPKLANLLLDPYFREVIERNQQRWRKVVATAAELGVPIPAFSSALSYYDSYRTARLSANMIQAQRDYFGAHTYERTDRPGSFHTEWSAS